MEFLQGTCLQLWLQSSDDLRLKWFVSIAGESFLN